MTFFVMEHSPGPWKIDRTRDTWPKAAVSDVNGFVVATVANGCDRMLIAIAPDLLAFAMEIVDSKIPELVDYQYAARALIVGLERQ